MILIYRGSDFPAVFLYDLAHSYPLPSANSLSSQSSLCVAEGREWGRSQITKSDDSVKDWSSINHANTLCCCLSFGQKCIFARMGIENCKLNLNILVGWNLGIVAHFQYTDTAELSVQFVILLYTYRTPSYIWTIVQQLLENAYFYRSFYLFILNTFVYPHCKKR